LPLRTLLGALAVRRPVLGTGRSLRLSLRAVRPWLLARLARGLARRRSLGRLRPRSAGRPGPLARPISLAGLVRLGLAPRVGGRTALPDRLSLLTLSACPGRGSGSVSGTSPRLTRRGIPLARLLTLTQTRRLARLRARTGLHALTLLVALALSGLCALTLLVALTLSGLCALSGLSALTRLIARTGLRALVLARLRLRIVLTGLHPLSGGRSVLSWLPGLMTCRRRLRAGGVGGLTRLAGRSRQGLALRAGRGLRRIGRRPFRLGRRFLPRRLSGPLSLLGRLLFLGLEILRPLGLAVLRSLALGGGLLPGLVFRGRLPIRVASTRVRALSRRARFGLVLGCGRDLLRSGGRVSVLRRARRVPVLGLTGRRLTRLP